MTGIAPWADRWIGVPYKDKGRTREGADCLGLVRLVLEDVQGVRIPSYAEDYPTGEELESVARAVDRRLGEWAKADPPEPGDVVLLWIRHPDRPTHLGIYVGGGRMLSVREGTLESSLEPVDRGFWARRVVGYYRYVGAEESGERHLPAVRCEPALRASEFRVVALPRPLSHKRFEAHVRVGATIEDVVSDLVAQRRAGGGGELRVLVGDTVVPRRMWRHVKPKAGTDVYVLTVAQGGIIIAGIIWAAQALATLGSTIAAGVGLGGVATTVGSAVAGGALSAGIGVVGAGILGNIAIGLTGLAIGAGVGFAINAALTAVASPPERSNPRLTGRELSPTVSGLGNDLRPHAPIPRVEGRHRVYPPLFAPAYTEVEGDKQWILLGMALAGRYQIEDIQVGEVPIAQIAGAEWEVREGGIALSYPEEILDEEPDGDAPVGYWRLADAAGATEAANEVAGGPPLALVGAPAFQQPSILAQGDDGAASMAFTESDMLDAGDPVLTVTDDFAIEMWLDMGILSGFFEGEYCALYCGTESLDGFGLIHKQGVGWHLRIAGEGDIDTGLVQRIDFSAGLIPLLIGPSHVVLVRRSGDWQLFVDGQPSRVLSSADPVTPTGHFTVMGAYQDGSGYGIGMDGLASEVAVYEASLTDDEILFHYDLGRRQESSMTRGPVEQIRSRTVREQVVSATFGTARTDEPRFSGYTVRRVAGDAVRRLSVSLGIVGPLRLNEHGKRRTFEFALDIQYRRAGEPAESPWVRAPGRGGFGPVSGIFSVRSDGLLLVRGQTDEPTMVTFEWAVPEGEYEIRVGRHETEGPNVLPGGSDVSSVIANVEWIAARGIEFAEPFNVKGVATVGVRLPVEEVGSNVQRVSFRATSIIPHYDAAGNITKHAPSTNPARLALWALIGDANPRPEPESRINFEAWDALATTLDDEGIECGIVLDYAVNWLDWVNTLLRVGRASLSHIDGRWEPVDDRPRASRVTKLTPRNTSGWRIRRRFVDHPHAVRARFMNERNSYREDVLTVYWDGYSQDGASGTKVATKFEEIEIPGITDPELLHREVRIKMAEDRLRRETYECEMGPDHFLLRRGDRVGFAHPAALVGRHWGYVTEVTGTDPVLGVLIDQPVTYAPGESLGATLWKARGLEVPLDVFQKAHSGTGTFESHEITFEDPIAAPSGGDPDLRPEVGDFVTVGLSQLDVGDAIVLAKEPHEDMTASLELIPYQPQVYTAGDGPVPDFDAQLGDAAPPINVRRPPEPKFRSVVSDETAMAVGTRGALTPRIRVTFESMASVFWAVDGIEVQFRRADPVEDWRAVRPPALGSGVTSVTIGEVEEGAAYDIRARTVASDMTGFTSPGVTSSWVYVTGHVVVGKSTRPLGVQDLRLEQGSRLVWSYPDPPVDHAGFLVRVHVGTEGSWESAAPLHENPIASQELEVGRAGKGPRTYLVKAVDIAGNESASAARLVRDLGDLRVQNVVLEDDEHADGFPGSITNGTVDGGTGDLLADAEPSLFWPDDGETFWPADSSELYWDLHYKALLYEFTLLPAEDEVPSSLQLALDADGLTTVTYARDAIFWPDDSATFWPADAEDFWPQAVGFSPFPGAVDGIEQGYVLRVAIAAGRTRGRIRELRAVLDVPDVEERLNDVALSAGGTRLPIKEDYREIRVVNLTLHGGASGVTVKVLDKDPDNGPLVQAFDDTGAGTAETIDAFVQGY